MSVYGVKLERSVPLTLSRHPEAPADEEFARWCAGEKKAGRLLAVDLFSGAGGLGLGVEAAGWTVVAAADHDESALETHRANFRGRALSVDMSDANQVARLVGILRPLGIDLVAGGPPCQPFSRAGRAKIRSLVKSGTREAVDARKELWRAFVDVVLALRPRAVLMENVPDMAIGDDLLVIREIADILESADYTVDYRLVDAWRHGVPQHRKRFILQARNDGVRPRWPRPSDRRTTVRDALGDLPPLGDTTGARELPYVGEPSSELAKSLRGGSPGGVVYDHMTRPVRDDDREAFKLMTSSTLYADLPEHLRRYRSDTFDDKYKRLGWDDLSRTITAHIAKDGYWYIHPEEHRTLTVREAARVQTFPDGFRFSGTRSDAFRQIGNAVPPLLGRVVAESLLPDRSAKRETSPVPAIRSRLSEWAIERREAAWWLFPGPHTTPAAAAVAALLDAHRLADDVASDMMAPCKGARVLSLELLREIESSPLSKARLSTLRTLREALDAEGTKDGVTLVAPMLSPARRALFALLRGHDTLLVNQHVVEVVSLLTDLPEGQKGALTDVKVALAQLVATGPNAALRMCAIRALTTAEASSRIKPAPSARRKAGAERAS